MELSGRANDLAEWKAATGGEVLAVQMRSGSVGIDLTRAHWCAYYSIGFSLGDYDQSLARVRRPGQIRDVVYYHFVARGLIDERVYTALANRRDVVAEVLNGLGSQAEDGAKAEASSHG